MTNSTLLLDGMIIPVQTGGMSRRAKLTVERDGSLQLRAAEDVATDELQMFVASKRDWIYKKLAEKEALQHEPIIKEVVDGEGFLYLGRSHRLQITATADHRVRLDRGRLVLPASLRETGYQHIIAWYQRCGTAWLRPRVADWAARLRVEPSTLEVGDLGHKWGAATAGGRVRLHWAAMQLRPALVDYVLAHELAHLREPHHGPAFWVVLRRAMPDFDDRKDELAKTGSGLWLGERVRSGEQSEGIGRGPSQEAAS
jgi:predicted metal-dependent hydrolase